MYTAGPAGMRKAWSVVETTSARRSPAAASVTIAGSWTSITVGTGPTRSSRMGATSPFGSTCRSWAPTVRSEAKRVTSETSVSDDTARRTRGAPAICCGAGSGSLTNVAAWLGSGTATRLLASAARPPTPGSDVMAAGTPPAGASTC